MGGHDRERYLRARVRRHREKPYTRRGHSVNLSASVDMSTNATFRLFLIDVGRLADVAQGMQFTAGLVSLLLLLAALCRAGCDHDDTPPGGTSYSNTDPNPATPCADAGAAQAGEPCATDCDCCALNCATYTDLQAAAPTGWRRHRPANRATS